MRPTVLVVDDHAEFRASARALLESEGFEVVGDVAGGLAALEAVERIRPQVVLLDVQLPDLDGFAVADRLASGSARPDVVLVSGRDTRTYAARIGAADVRGFIAKDDLSGAALARLLA